MRQNDQTKENSWIELGEEMESNYQRNNHRIGKVLERNIVNK
jgi:hypothetical protein